MKWGDIMFNVQLVDDEPIIRRGLEELIDWASLGFQIVCAAQNGKQALEQLETEEVDLIITDIEMPIMNGLNLVREVREKDIDKEIVVLTAYEEFEYAKAAIKYGITEYVLKPIDEEELTRILKSVKCRLEKKRSFY